MATFVILFNNVTVGEMGEVVNNLRFSLSLIIHYGVIWPILGRVYYIQKLVSFNYTFHHKVNPNNFLQFEEELDNQNKLLKETRTRHES